jgi:hypothetical protein
MPEPDAQSLAIVSATLNGAAAVAGLAAVATTGDLVCLAVSMQHVVVAAALGLAGFGAVRGDRHFWSLVVGLLLFSLGSGVVMTIGLDPAETAKPATDLWPVFVALAGAGAAHVVLLSMARTAIAQVASAVDAPDATFRLARRHPEIYVATLAALGGLASVAIAFGALAVSHGSGPIAAKGTGVLLIASVIGTMAALAAVEVKAVLGLANVKTPGDDEDEPVAGGISEARAAKRRTNR